MRAIDIGRSERGVGKFLTARAARGTKESSLETYARLLGMVRMRAPRPLLELTEDEAFAVAAELAKMKSGPTIGTVARMFFSFHEMPKHAEAFRVRRTKRRIDPRSILTIEDVNALIRAARDLREAAFVATLWETGARIHEVLSLDIGSVSRIESSENGGRLLYKLWFAKTKTAGEEHAAMLIDAATHLDRWLDAYPVRKTKGAPLFLSGDARRLGERLSVNGARYILHSLGKRAGIRKPVHPHAFRHARATHLLRHGMTEAQVKRMLGWVPGSAMLERYSHLVDEDAHNALLEMHGLRPKAMADAVSLAEPDPNLPALPSGGPASQEFVRERIAALEAKFEMADTIKTMAMDLLDDEARTALRDALRKVYEKATAEGDVVDAGAVLEDLRAKLEELRSKTPEAGD